MAGFLDSLKKNGIDVDPCGFPNGNWKCDSGYEAMQTILACGEIPTAVFAANDRMAIGAMQAILDAGLRIPGDISVMGLDDIEVAAFQSPPLTTIRQSFPQMASLSVHLLIDILERKEPDQTQIVMEPTFIHRKSTAAPSHL
jgi:LacI family transcriptional regulator